MNNQYDRYQPVLTGMDKNNISQHLYCDLKFI